MTRKRRPLIAGVKTSPKLPSEAETAFVYGQASQAIKPKRAKPAVPKRNPPDTEIATAPVRVLEAERTPPITNVGRVPLTTRIRSDIAYGLKRASLERQLAREEPNTVQELLEAALEPWLKEKGYLP